mgnify:CR=1 FL=1
MNKAAKHRLVHLLRLRKRQCFSHITSDSLAKRVVPSFHMIGLSLLLTETTMPVVVKDRLVGFIQIAVTERGLIRRGDRLPEFPGFFFFSGSNHKCHNLSRSSAQSRPQPTRLRLFAHEGPDLVQFQHISLLIGTEGGF